MSPSKEFSTGFKLLSLLLASFMLFSCGQTDGKKTTFPSHVVEKGTIISTIDTSGIVVMSPNALGAQLSFGVNGVLGEIWIVEGAEVSKGQILAELDSKTIRQLETKVIQSRIQLREAQKALEGAAVGYDPSNPEKTLTGAPLQELRRLQAIERNSTLAFDNAVRDSELTKISWETKLESKQDQYDDALKEYNKIFKTWLGINLKEGEETSIDPEELLTNLGITLEDLFNPQTRKYSLPQYTNSTTLPEDDPSTRWDEEVVYTWNNFYPGVIKVECDNDTQFFGELCIRRAIDNTWTIFHSIDQSLKSETLSAKKAFASSENQIANANKSLSDAKRNLNQFLNNPKLDMEFRLSQLESAEKSLDESEVDLDNARLTAPFGGRIIHIYVSQNDTLGSNDAILRLVDPTDVEIQTSIEPSLIPDIQLGQTAEIILDRYPEIIIIGELIEIGKPEDQPTASNSLPISLRINKPTGLNLREGLTGQVRLIHGRAENVLTVPRDSVRGINSDNKTGIVTLILDGSTQDQTVKLGISDGTLVEILDGLNEGDEILAQHES